MGMYGGRSVAHADAQEQARDGVAVYFRPGCPFCLSMRTGLLGQGGKVAWVNIWQDDEARAYVRSINGGNETVPTVVIDGVAHTNPTPGSVRRRLRAAQGE